MKTYIDCGAFVGRTLEKYPASEYKRYAFECNPLLADVKYPEDVEVIREAVWVKNGIINFYVNNANHETEGCSVYKDKTTGDLNTVLPVQCIDFSEWLQPSSYTIVKMNIEGAEYEVLEKCIETGTINLIHELFIYWHFGKIPSITAERHDNLVQKLKTIFGDRLHSLI